MESDREPSIDYRIVQVCPAPADMYVVFHGDGEPYSWPADCLMLVEESSDYNDHTYRWVQAVALSEGRYSPLEIHFDTSIGSGRGEFRPDDWRGLARHHLDVKEAVRIAREREDRGDPLF